MCGIWAIIGNGDNAMTLMSCFQQISQRGPDCFRVENIKNYKTCCLGFHRLAIVGEADGMQPMRIYEYPHILLVCNGEIYNFKTIISEMQVNPSTNNDIESMLHLYAKYGAVKMAQQLDGVFGCIIFDELKRKVFLIRDRHGVRPLKYFITDEGILGACSEAKGLIDACNLRDGKVQIDVVKPGMVLEFDLRSNGTVERNFKEHAFGPIGTKPLFVPAVLPNPDLDICGNIRNLLKSAVQKRLQSDRRIGCLLSGGLDSSLIAGLLVQCMKESNIDYKLQTFSIGMGDDGIDILAARKVAKFLGTEHFEVNFTIDDGIKILPELIQRLETFDITTIRASIGMYLIAKYIQKNTNNIVIFSGEGSDELTGGYIYFHKAPSPEAFHNECLRLLNDLYYFDIRRADRTLSGCGLEARVPFLDTYFTSYYLNIDAKLRQPKDSIEKWLLRKSFSGLNLIPEDILWRPKEAFSDGVSRKNKKPFFELLKDHFDAEISNEEFSRASETYPRLTPPSKEAFYYRKIFEKYYPNQEKLTPYFWMPRFIEANDPSARMLSHYKSSDTIE